MTTDTSERGLERLICTALTGSACEPRPKGASAVRSDLSAPYGGVGYLQEIPRTTTASIAWIWRSSRPSCG